MNIIDQSMSWVRGEIVEHAAVGILGLSILAIASLLWKFGSVPAARGLIVPFLVVGAIFVVISAAGMYTNVQRVSSFQRQFDSDPEAFVAAETVRTKGFLTWYPYTLGAASVLIVAGLALFNVAAGPTARGVSLALILLGVGGLLIDNVSESNAKRYYSALESHDAVVTD